MRSPRRSYYLAACWTACLAWPTLASAQIQLSTSTDHADAPGTSVPAPVLAPPLAPTASLPAVDPALAPPPPVVPSGTPTVAPGPAETVAPAPAETVAPPVAPAPAETAPPPVEAAPVQSATPNGETPSGPTLTLADEHTSDETDANGSGTSTDPASERRASDKPLTESSTAIGGYAQFNVTSVRQGSDADFDTRGTLRRMVLFVSHEFNDSIRAMVELEWENAVACSTCSGSAEVEQAYVDWQLAGRALVLRTGLVLVPMGIINQWHEPPVFNGVERPRFDQTIIPSTWRELAIGPTGKLGEAWDYEAYVTSTITPSQMGPDGFTAARGLASSARLESAALTGRLGFEPVLGAKLDVSFFVSDAGGNDEYYTSAGKQIDFFFPIVGVALSARFTRQWFEARAVAAAFFFPEAGALLKAYRADGNRHFPNSDRTGAVPERTAGGYVEAGVNLLHWSESGHSLVSFVRTEAYNTQSAVPSEYRPNGLFNVQELTAGLTYRPISELVFKTDVQLRDRREGLDELQLNAGMGYMY